MNFGIDALVAASHGLLDQFYSGLRTAFSGIHYDPITVQLLEKSGVPHQTAHFVNNIISVGCTLGGAAYATRAAQSLYAPASNLPNTINPTSSTRAVFEQHKTISPPKNYPLQKHHFATNKHKIFSPQMKSIAQQFGLSLEEPWNTQIMPHLGRHPHDYHEFVLFSMQKAAKEAKGNTQVFLQLFDKYVKTPIMNNPELLNKVGWEVL
ncbi:MAG: AHH domain-containing protein [Candidatus Thorarchaeota archaeon]